MTDPTKSRDADSGTLRGGDSSLPPDPVAGVLRRMWEGPVAAQAIHAAVRLGLADALAHGPRSAEDLADWAGADAGTLARLMGTLTGLGIFARANDGAFKNTPTSEILRGRHPDSLAPWSHFLGAAWVWDALEALPEALQGSDRTAFEIAHGESVWDYLADHPEAAATFDRAMACGTAASAPRLVGAYDFSGCGTIVDVGGGEGALIKEILRATPGPTGVLYDLPSVVARVAAKPLNEHLESRLKIEGGNFFEAVPRGETYLLKSVLHDWSDEHAVRILESCRDEVPPGGRVLVIEMLTGEGGKALEGLFDLLMYALTGGRERTRAEYRVLLERADFRLTRVVRSETPLSVMEARPVQRVAQ